MRLSVNTNKVFVFVVIILIAFGLLVFQNGLKCFFYSKSESLQDRLWCFGESFSSFIDGATNGREIRRENEELAKENEILLSRLVSFDQLQEENNKLRRALDLNLTEEFNLILADISSKDVSFDSFIIDKGIEDGITAGSVVISEEKVLLGKITEVYKKTARVILISNKEASFPVEIMDKDIVAIAKGKENYRVSLEEVPQEKELTEGDLVVTTSLGGDFPKGLLVGKITNIKKNDIDSFQSSDLDPFFDIGKTRSVFIITNF